MDTMWDPRAERMPADERAELQARRLDDLVGRLAERSPLYRERLAGAGVGPGARVGLEGLAGLPFTTKQDLWDGYPWGYGRPPRAGPPGPRLSGTGPPQPGRYPGADWALGPGVPSRWAAPAPARGPSRMGLRIRTVHRRLRLARRC